MSAATRFSDSRAHCRTRPADDVRDGLRVRLEEAALNATAVAAQQPHDGWLVRYAASPAKRMRSINVLGLSTRPLDERLAYCSSLYSRRGLPMVFRLTSIGPDFSLDDELDARGYLLAEETRVMSAALTPGQSPDVGTQVFEAVDAARFAEEVGRMRGALPQHVDEHRVRLAALAVDISPVLARTADGRCVAAGLAVRDDDLLGLFDIVTHPEERRKGHAGALVEYLLAQGAAGGAAIAYLQVEPDNTAARALYARYGFKDCYAYWYRLPAEQADA